VDLHFAADDRWRWLPWRANCTCGGWHCREMTRQERARRRFAAAVGLTEEGHSWWQRQRRAPTEDEKWDEQW
jgi:hypothetical protein